MKKLYLIRHADAPHHYDQDDWQRELSEFGKTQAEKLATKLSFLKEAKNYKILCSDAPRAIATIKPTSLKLDNLKIDYEHFIYKADEEEILNQLSLIDSKIEILLIIGHNPTISQLAFMLDKDDHFENFPTCCIKKLTADISDWQYLAKKFTIDKDFND